MDIHDWIEKNVLPQVKQPLWESWYIKEKIGSGVSSVVYRMEANRAGAADEAALKIEAVTDEGLLALDEGFKRAVLAQKLHLAVDETRIMKQLRDCPNIVRCEEECTQELYLDGRFEGYYRMIRMEYLKNVYAMMRDRAFDASETNVRRLAGEIGNGLKAAHSIGIVHGGIKPEKMFQSAAGVYKLGSFHRSKQAVSGSSDSYTAPEVLRSGANASDSDTVQADIYSFGICLYQMMNGGLLPFAENCPAETAVARRLQGEPFPPPKHASPAFGQIIMKACAHDPANRYSSIEDLLRDLSQLTAVSSNTPAQSAVPSTANSNPSMQEKKSRSIWVYLCAFAGGLVLVLLAILLVRGLTADDSAADGTPAVSDDASADGTDRNDTSTALQRETTAVSESRTETVQTTAESTSAEPIPAEPEGVDVYMLYKEYFFNHYTQSDLVCMADVTHDGTKEMIVVHIADENAQPTEQYPYACMAFFYTVRDQQVQLIYQMNGGYTHAEDFFDLYLVKSGDFYNIGDEHFFMWQGIGTLSFSEYYLTPTGEIVPVSTISTDNINIANNEDGTVSEARMQAYLALLNQKIENAYLIYSNYTNATVKPLPFETNPSQSFVVQDTEAANEPLS